MNATFLLALVLPLAGQADGDRMLADYFRTETRGLAKRCLADVHSLEDWTSRRAGLRRQLAEMLGLDPPPERSDLRAAVTGKHETDWFTVENLHFQSRPGLYVTGNLYVPKGLDKPAPAVLYVCGHAQVKKNGVSYGNKVHYQHHAGWFARNGYVCLVIDTLQLGEIEGLHHGTYRERMWWWNARGYTPAGVEAWNCVRALDYLQSRPEVDRERLGVTGRSGGGAYSWWAAALDERVKAAAPVAGITDLENHVVDGCVEGHCDCMFMVNTYRWDYPEVAALIAPRALLIANTDSDPIFPLDGVERLHAKVRNIYRLHGADERLGLQISPGGHQDTQELQVAVSRWFNRFLKEDAEARVEQTGIAYFAPEELQVFRDGLPSDQINTRIQEDFASLAASPRLPESQQQWAGWRDAWMTALAEKCFRGWPDEPGPFNVAEVASIEQKGGVARVCEFDSQPGVRLRLYLYHDARLKEATRIRFSIGVDDTVGRATVARLRDMFADRPQVLGLPEVSVEAAGADLPQDTVSAVFFPRGTGATAWNPEEKKQTQNRRRFMLLGQTLAGMQIWDVRRALQAVRSLPSTAFARQDPAKSSPDKAQIDIHAGASMSVPALYATLFEPAPTSLTLFDPPTSHADGPDLLNVLRFLDVPQAVAMAAERGVVIQITTPDTERWRYPAAVIERLRWPGAMLTVGANPM
ncbi:MAG TPA: acetylxylan esterase [Pirellulales bacterium]|nr:acetylxylan esterase [Pirellulales bacterium]